VLKARYRREFGRFVTMLTLAAGLLACATPPSPPVNPFLGTWSTANNDSVTIRQDTVVQTEPDGRTTALDAKTCRGVFQFGYTTKSRQALTDLIPRQPDLRRKLAELLAAASYPVVELDCDRGDQTYVLLNDRQLVAIYRDGDIGAIERLARREMPSGT
jgi:hypothetical protein